ncbi:hypothetical protein T265_15850, partial [Opisthorchis viverrini]
QKRNSRLFWNQSEGLAELIKCNLSGIVSVKYAEKCLKCQKNNKFDLRGGNVGHCDGRSDRRLDIQSDETP